MRRVLQSIIQRFSTWLFVSILVAMSYESSASAREIFELTPERRIQWLLSKEFDRERTKFLPGEVLDSLSLLCEEYHDEKLLWYVKLYRFLGIKNYRSLPITGITEKCPFPEVKALLFHYLGLGLLENYNFEDGLRNLLAANKIFEEIGYEKLFYGGECLNALGLNYYYSGYYVTALKYWKRAIRCQFVNIHFKVSVLNNIGLANMAESIKNYPEASRYFAMCYNLARKFDPVYIPVSISYYGRSLQLMGRTEQSLRYLVYGYNHANDDYGYNHYTDNFLRGKIALFVAEAYLDLDSLLKAKDYLQRYRLCVANIGPLEMNYNSNVKVVAIALPYYDVQAQFFKKLGNFGKAKSYQIGSLALKDSLDRLSAYKFLDNSEGMINAEKYFSESHKIQSKREKEVSTRNLVIALLSFMGAGAAYLIWVRRSKLVKEKEIADKQKVYTEQQVETSLETLAQYVHLIHDKNQLLEKISGELYQLKLKTGSLQKEEVEIHDQIDTLLSSIILTDDDWENFKVLFEQVYPGFLRNLKNKFKDLSQAEIRLATLTKLNVPTKEMAFMLSVNKETIHTARYRLRKKLAHSDSNVDLKELVENI